MTKNKSNLLIAAILTIAVISAFGCDITGEKAETKINDMQTVCIEGVTYYLFREIVENKAYGYMSVKLGRNSQVVLCGGH